MKCSYMIVGAWCAMSAGKIIGPSTCGACSRKKCGNFLTLKVIKKKGHSGCGAFSFM